MRTAEIKRVTNETEIAVKVNLDGSGKHNINTKIGFFKHMLEQLSKHSGIDIDMDFKKEDLEVDQHHSVEDAGYALGEAIRTALGDKKGIERYACVMMVMDEVRCDVALDLGGRNNLVFNLPALTFEASESEKEFDYSLVKEFMKALTDELKATLHINDPYSLPESNFNKLPAYEIKVETSLAALSNNVKNVNKHHMAEAAFKGLARVLKKAVMITGTDIPSTKGVI